MRQNRHHQPETVGPKRPILHTKVFEKKRKKMYCLLVCLAVLAVSFLGTSAAVEVPKIQLSQFGFTRAPVVWGNQALRGATNAQTLAQSNGWGIVTFYDNNKCTGKPSLMYMDPYGTCLPTEHDGQWQKNSYKIIKKGTPQPGGDVVHSESYGAKSVAVDFIATYYSDSMCMMRTGGEHGEFPTKCSKAGELYTIATQQDILPNPPTGGVVTT
jgi:hypothetical protein